MTPFSLNVSSWKLEQYLPSSVSSIDSAEGVQAAIYHAFREGGGGKGKGGRAESASRLAIVFLGTIIYIMNYIRDIFSLQ
jgi:hypothetical protein